MIRSTLWLNKTMCMYATTGACVSKDKKKIIDACFFSWHRGATLSVKHICVNKTGQSVVCRLTQRSRQLFDTRTSCFWGRLLTMSLKSNSPQTVHLCNYMCNRGDCNLKQTFNSRSSHRSHEISSDILNGVSWVTKCDPKSWAPVEIF